MEPDPSEHIGLVGHVVRQMGISGDLAEECFSEGLVILAVASQKFDESRSLPLANWLARNLRWGISNWLSRQRPTVELPEAIEAPRDPIWSQIELKEVLVLAKEILEPAEFLVVMGKAYGYKGKEMAKVLGCSEGQVSRLHQRGVAKLKEKHA